MQYIFIPQPDTTSLTGLLLAFHLRILLTRERGVFFTFMPGKAVTGKKEEKLIVAALSVDEVTTSPS